MEFLDKNANAGNYTSCSISAADAQKARIVHKSRESPRKRIVALSRKFMLETAVGVFRVQWPCAASFFPTSAAAIAAG